MAPAALSSGERPLAIKEAPALHLFLDHGDAPERGFDKGYWIGLSVLDRGGDLFDRAWIGDEGLCGHGASFVLRRPAVSI
jgi:hypothetical protein